MESKYMDQTGCLKERAHLIFRWVLYKPIHALIEIVQPCKKVLIGALGVWSALKL